MTRRLITTAVAVLAAVLVSLYVAGYLTDEAFGEYEAEQIAQAFEEVGAQVDQSPESLQLLPNPPDEELVRVGKTRVYATEDRYVVARSVDGQLLRLADLELAWFPGTTAQVYIAVASLSALFISVVMTVPLVRRVRRLEAAVRTFADGDLETRADVPGGDEVARLAGHFNQMADRVETQIETQRSLVQAIAHEYRTPLARARLATALLEDAQDEDDRTVQAGRLKRALDDLEGLADEVRFYARAGGKLVVDEEPVSPRRIAEHVRDALQVPEGKTLAIEVPEDLTLAGDARLLRRVVGNLVSNGLRYANTVVRVHAEHDDATVRLIVDDDGPGVPEDERDRIFEPFVRLEPSRSSTGYGLGLAIASRMAARHGGEATVEASPEGGARFVVSLPVG